MKKSKRVYSESFKEKAVSLSYQRENIKELADELGIQVQLIYKCRASGRKQVNLKSISPLFVGIPEFSLASDPNEGIKLTLNYLIALRALS